MRSVLLALPFPASTPNAGAQAAAPQCPFGAGPNPAPPAGMWPSRIDGIPPASPDARPA